MKSLAMELVIRDGRFSDYGGGGARGRWVRLCEGRERDSGWETTIVISS